MENTLIEKFKEIKQTLKERGNQTFSKEEFLESVFKKLDSNALNQILEENTPKEFFINEAISSNPELKEKFYEMIKKEK
jgi:hypothetical protein